MRRTYGFGSHLFTLTRQLFPLILIKFGDCYVRRGVAVVAGTLLGWIGADEVRSPFSGELMSWLALDGERVTASQPIAWLRVE